MYPVWYDVVAVLLVTVFIVGECWFMTCSVRVDCADPDLSLIGEAIVSLAA